jgi:hypothetical protein
MLMILVFDNLFIKFYMQPFFFLLFATKLTFFCIYLYFIYYNFYTLIGFQETEYQDQIGTADCWQVIDAFFQEKGLG